MDDFPYEAGASEKVKIFEAELKADLAELKAELEDNDGISRVVSSVAVPKDVIHFTRERALAIKRGLRVSEAMPLVVQADQMTRELHVSLMSDYSTDGFPLLLLQYFLDRIHQIVQCKYMHLLRWKRFQAHSGTMETLYPDFKERMELIMSEYSDCIQRAQRLSIAHEAFLAKDNRRAVASVKPDDAFIYLRWLVSHLASLKKFHQYLRVLEWLPVVHRMDVVLPSSVEEETDDSPVLGTLRNVETKNDLPTESSSSNENLFLSPLALVPTSSAGRASDSSNTVSALAATGGGLSSDEKTLSLPICSNELIDIEGQLKQFLILYDIDVKVDTTMLSSDELELYSVVVRKFQSTFVQQENMRTFKTYDFSEIGHKSWGIDSSTRALKKESNWTSFISLKSDVDPYQEKQLTELRKRKNVDLLLNAQSHFIKVTDVEKVKESLKEHAAAVREPPNIAPINLDGKVTHKVEGTAAIWQKIYTNPQLYRKIEKNANETTEATDGRDADSRAQMLRRSSGRTKRKNSYNYFNAVQMLGLDDGDQENKDSTSVQGAYLSFLSLRHLRIRDLQRTGLSILNYFRSIERTLTINDAGLTCDGNHYKKTSSQDHRRVLINGTSDDGLGSHQYMHNTPADYRISETDFMEFSEVENHDDFYNVESGRIHVQDQRGFFIVYDAAIDDFKNLENDLLLIVSYFLEKDRDKRNICNVKRSNSGRQSQQEFAGDNNFSIGSYAHREVDRFGMLLDLWSNEVAYLQSKKELLDCYTESYHHVFDRDEKRRVAQAMTDVMHRRPRFDFQSDYFIKSYRLECVCLQLETKLVKTILDNQIDEQRDYISKISRNNWKWGMPHPVIKKQPISVNSTRSRLKDVYLLEFHPSLSIASQIPAALKHAYWELHNVHQPSSVIEMICLQKKMLECAIDDWDDMPTMGSSYSHQVQKELFESVFIEDPSFVCDAVQTLSTHAEQQSTKKSLIDRQMLAIGCLGNMMDLVTMRFRLIDVAWQTEILAKIYKKQMAEISADNCHLHLRFVQFEFAQFKETASKPPPTFITALQENDAQLDRFTPNFLFLAINELDESHVGRFSFRNLDGVLQMLRDKPIDSIRIVLATQIVHKNNLVCAVQLSNVCYQIKETTSSNDSPTRSEIKTEKGISAYDVMGTSAVTAGDVMSVGRTLQLPSKSKRSAQAFLSLQLEKLPYRDRMLNEFVRINSQMSTALKNPVEMEKLKRKLILQFCDDLNNRLAQNSLRGQIIAYYNSIIRLIDKFPSVKENYFMIGEPNERESIDESSALEPDPRLFKRRPRCVMSEDGKSILNIWFLPHYSDVLNMFRKMNDDNCRQALTNLLKIVGSLHDMLQYLCAHAQLDGSWGFTDLGFCSDGGGVAAAWGGVDGIGTELQDIQKQIDNLSSKSDPEVVSRFLSLRRDVMFQEFDFAVRHGLRNSFLTTGNIPAYKAVTNCMHFALHFLSDSKNASVLSTLLNLPEPLEAGDAYASKTYPWRDFINSHGPYPIHFWQWHMIEYNVHLCLAGLPDIDRKVANAELVSISLLMEDVLISGIQDNSEFMVTDELDLESPTCATSTVVKKHHAIIKAKPDDKGYKRKSLSQINQPLESYTLMKSFLCLWKRLEKFKENWGKTKLGVDEINTTALYKTYSKDYRKEILLPIMQHIAKEHNEPDLYDGLISDDDPIILPKGTSEIESKTRQLVKLLERLEGHMIIEVKKKIQKELTLTMAERTREENVLPTDLWKRPAIKESFTIAKPQIVENFLTQLMSHANVEGDKVIMTRECLNERLNELSQTIMARERVTYESYSTYYENLLRSHHQLLYQKEQEVKYLKDQMKVMQSTMSVEVQCQLADTSQDLLLEIIALRAKIAEMRDVREQLEQEVRGRVRKDYNGLVQGLLASNFDIKTRFDEFRKDLYDDVIEKISQTRSEAAEAVSRLAQRSGANIDSETTKRSLTTMQQLRDLQRDNHSMDVLLLKLQATNKWKLYHEKEQRDKQKSHLTRIIDTNAKDKTKERTTCEKEKQLLQEQLNALRSALKVSQAECDIIRKDLEKEMKEKTDKSHSTQQQALSLKQLEEARLAKIKKLYSELEDNKGRLQNLSEEQEKNRKLQHLNQEKIKRDVESTKKQLQFERSLKLNAFQCLEELRAEIDDKDTVPQNTRPHTAISASRTSRMNSAGPKSASRASRAASAPFRPALTWTGQRCLSAAVHNNHNVNNEDSIPNNAVEYRKLQRPKTGNVRFRNLLAEQLLNELDPPSHRELSLRIKSASILRSHPLENGIGLLQNSAVN